MASGSRQLLMGNVWLKLLARSPYKKKKGLSQSFSRYLLLTTPLTLQAVLRNIKKKNEMLLC